MYKCVLYKDVINYAQYVIINGAQACPAAHAQREGRVGHVLRVALHELRRERAGQRGRERAAVLELGAAVEPVRLGPARGAPRGAGKRSVVYVGERDTQA